jgi:hypothetical protein
LPFFSRVEERKKGCAFSISMPKVEVCFWWSKLCETADCDELTLSEGSFIIQNHHPSSFDEKRQSMTRKWGLREHPL